MNRRIFPILALTAVSVCGIPGAVLAEEAPRKAKAPAPIFVPFDFYPRHQQALGLQEDQVRAMQRIADRLQQDAGELEREREKRTQALQAAVEQNPVDVERAMASFRAVLEAENELKALQFRSGLAMRNALTPEQLGKVQTLAAKDGAGRVEGARVALSRRVQQLRSEISKRGDSQVPPQVLARIQRIEESTRAGRLAEAKNELEAVLRQLRGEPEPGSPPGEISKAPVAPPR